MVADPLARIGEVVGDRYEIQALIGSGGQGHVYRARDRVQGDAVALKLLRAEFLADPAWRERAFREARILSLLSNTAAVRVLDQKWAADGALCVVMELLEGESLEDVLERRAREAAPVSPVELVQWITPIVTTLEVAHNNDILHRDLKPENVFMMSSGGVRLIDFGFAKFERLLKLTQSGEVAGSPTYLAPECWSRDPGPLTRKVDVYALGALIFRALAGHPPFEGNPIDLLRCVPHAPRPSLHALRPDLPARVDDWVQAALAVSPGERFDSVSALWTAFQLAAFAQREGSASAP